MLSHEVQAGVTHLQLQVVCDQYKIGGGAIRLGLCFEGQKYPPFSTSVHLGWEIWRILPEFHRIPNSRPFFGRNICRNLIFLIVKIVPTIIIQF